MKRRYRRRRGALAAFGVLGALGFACTFPDVTFAPAGVGAEGGASEAGGGTLDGGGPADAPPTIFADAFAELEASAVQDDAGKVDASACVTCDCDGDQSNHADGGCNTGGNVPDCDDTDGRTHPGVDWRDDKAEAPRFGDWDCDGTVEKSTPINFDCSKVDLNSCPAAAGFAGDPGCGTEADLLGCKIVTSGIFPLQTTSCVQDSTKTKKQIQLCK